MYKFSILISLIFLLVVSSPAQTPQQIEKTLLGHLAKLKKHSSQGSSGDSGIVDKENTALKNELLRYCKQRKVLQYSFPNLSKKMFVTTSRDGKFRIYSWDNEFGGTMRDYESIFQYQGAGSKVYTYERTRTHDGDVGPFYHQIFQIPTAEGTVYLANSTFIASTSSANQDLSSFRIDGSKLNTSVKIIKTMSGIKNSVGFQYDFFTVVDHPERPVKLFYYDETKKSFRFPIVIQDKRNPQGRVTKRFITYKFDGKYFVRN